MTNWAQEVVLGYRAGHPAVLDEERLDEAYRLIMARIVELNWPGRKGN